MCEQVAWDPPARQVSQPLARDTTFTQVSRLAHSQLSGPHTHDPAPSCPLVWVLPVSTLLWDPASPLLRMLLRALMLTGRPGSEMNVSSSCLLLLLQT